MCRVRTYIGGFNRWKRWAKSNGLPANSFNVAKYLKVILQSASSASPINPAVYNIDWLHRSAGCPKVSFQCMVHPLMNASKRILAKPKCRKEPITPKILRQLAERLKDKSCTASSRTLALCIIALQDFFLSVTLQYPCL